MRTKRNITLVSIYLKLPLDLIRQVDSTCCVILSFSYWIDRWNFPMFAHVEEIEEIAFYLVENIFIMDH